MLQRVVGNRSAGRLPSITVSGATVWDHRSYGILGKLKQRGAVSGPRLITTAPFIHFTPSMEEQWGLLSIILLRNFRAEVFGNVWRESPGAVIAAVALASDARVVWDVASESEPTSPGARQQMGSMSSQRHK